VGLWELLAISVGLAMDAFAVSVCKGLAIGRARWRQALVAGVWFGGFQALAPLIGYFLGERFRAGIMAYDHWIAFGLLALIGLNMVREALFGDEEQADAKLNFAAMLPLAVATSIDALAVGVSFSLLQVRLWGAISCIGAVTFALSTLGLKLGSRLGLRYKKGAEIVGGALLVLLGVRILIEHLVGHI